jgi:DNA-binding NarL/FixJ family response regulator
MSTRTIRIALVEDDKLIREGFTLLISSTYGYRVVGAYGSCEEALKHLAEDEPEVVLMDLELPGMSGIEGIEKIKKQRPKTNVIVVSVYDQPERVFQALCAGAGGYLTKNMQPARLLEAIKDIQEGGAPMSTSIARMVVSSFQKNRNSPLTARETEVLERLAKGKSYSSIAEDLFIDKETVRTHIKNIYWKLEVHSKADAIEKALKDKLI